MSTEPGRGWAAYAAVAVLGLGWALGGVIVGGTMIADALSTDVTRTVSCSRRDGRVSCTIESLRGTEHVEGPEAELRFVPDGGRNRPAVVKLGERELAFKSDAEVLYGALQASAPGALVHVSPWYVPVPLGVGCTAAWVGLAVLGTLLLMRRMKRRPAG